MRETASEKLESMARVMLTEHYNLINQLIHEGR
jgi:hypothetical protein